VLASDAFNSKKPVERDESGGTSARWAAKLAVEGLSAPFAIMGARQRLEKWRAVI